MTQWYDRLSKTREERKNRVGTKCRQLSGSKKSGSMEAQSALTRSRPAGDEHEHVMGSLVRELTNDFLADHTFWKRKNLKDTKAVARLDSRTTKVCFSNLAKWPESQCVLYCGVGVLVEGGVEVEESFLRPVAFLQSVQFAFMWILPRCRFLLCVYFSHSRGLLCGPNMCASLERC